MPFFSPEDTISAISTPLGRSGLGIVRICGTSAVQIADKIFKPAGKKQLRYFPSHTVHHGWIHDSGQILDEVVVSVMLNPHSYTGDDTIEISAHGGPVTLTRILKLCISMGARQAQPGEFTFRAFLNGRMDLARAESVADLIESKTELAARAALNQLEGKLSKQIFGWRKKIIDLLSCLEVALDYSEEDIRFISQEDLLKDLSIIRSDIEKLKSTASKGRLLREGLKVSIIGKPNTGKSSLLNVLLERDRAIVADIPGTTRDIIEETLDLKGMPLVIVDTAGLREHTTDTIEKFGQERTLDSINKSDLILWVLDSSKEISREDIHVAELLLSMSRENSTIIILNKSEMPFEIDEADMKEIFPSNAPIIRISALTGKGLTGLEETILSAIHASDISTEDPLIINFRHIEILERSETYIGNAIASVKNKESEEFTAFHIREALNSIGEITGETATEDILENIFSRFCVGK